MPDPQQPVQITNATAPAIAGTIGGAILILFGGVTTLLGFAKVRDIAAMINWIHGTDGAAFLGAVTLIGGLAWRTFAAWWKQRKAITAAEAAPNSKAVVVQPNAWERFVPIGMGAVIVILAALLLAGCATVQRLTPAQGVYAALGAYESAQHTAADYAESPSASPAIVHKITTINDAPGTQAAVQYGRAYRACQGSALTLVPGLQCSMFDFSAANAHTVAVQLNTIATALLAR